MAICHQTRFVIYCTTAACLLLMLVHSATASWMYIGMASVGLAGRGHVTQDACAVAGPELAQQQQRMCRDHPEVMHSVAEGLKLAVDECHHQFEYDRWNCSTSRNASIFGPIINRGTRETAFIHAVTSAGVVHSTTSACSAGNLTDCSCDTSHPDEAPSAHEAGDVWTWGGCSDDVDYGIWFAKTFVDAEEEMRYLASPDARTLMNLHNNAVGRQMISNQMTVKCRCHGVSGSCAVKSCWRRMPNFRQIGDALKHKYEHSVRISHNSRRQLRRKEKRKRREPVPENELVFIETSPDYCQADPGRGVAGTRGRQCNRYSPGPDGCGTLCCGRGFTKQVVRTTERCQCKFVWCCQVKCRTCQTVTEKYFCK